MSTTTLPHVAGRRQLGAYTIPDGARVLYGERVDRHVRCPPDEHVVLDAPAGVSEDGNCRPPAALDGSARPDAVGEERLDREHEPTGTTGRRGPTGQRVELARYSISAGERVLYGQRVLGVVRVTDVPVAPGGRAYLVERGLEEDGARANAALHGLVGDYLRQAAILDEVPMAVVRL